MTYIEVPTAASIPPKLPRRRAEISKGLLARSVLSNWSFLFLNVLIAFWMTPFVIRHLGDSAYGIWALVLQLTGYMGVVDVGLRSAIVRFVSRFHAQSDHQAAVRLINTTLTLYAGMAPLCILIGILLAAFAVPHFHLPQGMLHEAQIALILAAACMACDFIFASYHSTFAALSRWDLMNGVYDVVIILRAAAVFLFLKLGFGLIAVALIQLCSLFVGYLTETLILRKLLPHYSFYWQKPNFVEMRPIFVHGWYSFLLSVANRINYQVDSIVIATFLPIGQVTFYIIGFRLVEYLRDLMTSTTMIVAPVISSLEAVGDSERITGAVIKTTKYSLFIGFLGAAGLFCLGRHFLRLWMGESFSATSGDVLLILSSGFFVSCTQFASNQILFGVSKHRLNLRWTILEAALNLGFSLLLVRRYGIFGVAAGTAAANLIARSWFFTRDFLRTMQVPWKKYIVNGIFPALIPSIGFCCGALVIIRTVSITSYFSLIAATLLGLVGFAVCLWFFSLNASEKSQLRNKIAQYRLGVSTVK